MDDFYPPEQEIKDPETELRERERIEGGPDRTARIWPAALRHSGSAFWLILGMYVTFKIVKFLHEEWDEMQFQIEASDILGDLRNPEEAEMSAQAQSALAVADEVFQPAARIAENFTDFNKELQRAISVNSDVMKSVTLEAKKFFGAKNQKDLKNRLRAVKDLHGRLREDLRHTSYHVVRGPDDSNFLVSELEAAATIWSDLRTLSKRDTKNHILSAAHQGRIQEYIKLTHIRELAQLKVALREDGAGKEEVFDLDDVSKKVAIEIRKALNNTSSAAEIRHPGIDEQAELMTADELKKWTAMSSQERVRHHRNAVELVVKAEVDKKLTGIEDVDSLRLWLAKNFPKLERNCDQLISDAASVVDIQDKVASLITRSVLLSSRKSTDARTPLEDEAEDLAAAEMQRIFEHNCVEARGTARSPSLRTLVLQKTALASEAEFDDLIYHAQTSTREDGSIDPAKATDRRLRLSAQSAANLREISGALCALRQLYPDAELELSADKLSTALTEDKLTKALIAELATAVGEQKAAADIELDKQLLEAAKEYETREDPKESDILDGSEPDEVESLAELKKRLKVSQETRVAMFVEAFNEQQSGSSRTTDKTQADLQAVDLLSSLKSSDIPDEALSSDDEFELAGTSLGGFLFGRGAARYSAPSYAAKFGARLGEDDVMAYAKATQDSMALHADPERVCRSYAAGLASAIKSIDEIGPELDFSRELLTGKIDIGSLRRQLNLQKLRRIGLSSFKDSTVPAEAQQYFQADSSYRDLEARIRRAESLETTAEIFDSATESQIQAAFKMMLAADAEHRLTLSRAPSWSWKFWRPNKWRFKRAFNREAKKPMFMLGDKKYSFNELKDGFLPVMLGQMQHLASSYNADINAKAQEALRSAKTTQEASSAAHLFQFSSASHRIRRLLKSEHGVRLAETNLSTFVTQLNHLGIDASRVCASTVANDHGQAIVELAHANIRAASSKIRDSYKWMTSKQPDKIEDLSWMLSALNEGLGARTGTAQDVLQHLENVLRQRRSAEKHGETTNIPGINELKAAITQLRANSPKPTPPPANDVSGGRSK